MIQSQNQTKAQFEELEYKIEISFNNIYNATSYSLKQISKSAYNLNSDIMNFILKFNNDFQIEMAINFMRILKNHVQNHIEIQIIPQLKKMKFNDQKQGFQNLESFIEIYQQYIQKSKYLLISLYFAINLIYPKNPQTALIDYLNYLLLQKISQINNQVQETDIITQLFLCFLQQLDLTYELIENNQNSSGMKISNVVKRFGDIFIKLQIEQANNKIKLEFTDKILAHFLNKYQELSLKWTQEYTIPIYLRKVKTQKELNNQILNFDDNSIKLQINNILEEQFLKNCKDFILSNNKPFNLESLLENYNSENLINHYELSLFNELYLLIHPNDKDIKTIIKEKILQEGKFILQQIKNQQIDQKLSHSFITSLFQLNQKYIQMIQMCFKNNTFIQFILTSAFEELVNLKNQQVNFQEYFVLYIEQEIEYSITSNQTNNKLLIDTIQLFMYILDKEDFIIYYQNRLAQRLLKYYRILFGIQFHQNYLKTEQLIIQQMSRLMGNDSIQPLELMIENISQSSDIINEIQTENHKLLTVLCPLLLKKQDWPKFSYQEIELNAQFQILKNLKLQFESQYNQKQIIWLDFLSYVDLEYAEKQITFHINIPQAIILFVYQYQNEFMSIYMISQITKLQEDLIQQNCQEMKTKNILEEIVIQDVKLYRFNEQCNDLQNTQINKLIIANTNIPIIYNQKTKQKRNLNQPLEAFILKTLKIKKTILLQDLVESAKIYIKNTFNKDVQDDQIIKLVNDFSDKNYLEIDESNPQLLRYI